MQNELEPIAIPEDASCGFLQNWLLVMLTSAWQIADKIYPAGSLIATDFTAFQRGLLNILSGCPALPVDHLRIVQPVDTFFHRFFIRIPLARTYPGGYAAPDTSGVINSSSSRAPLVQNRLTPGVEFHCCGAAPCKYPSKTNHSLLEIFRHTDYVSEEVAMRKTRFTEHQIIAVLKSVEPTKMSIVRSLFLKPVITTGRRNMVGWKSLILKRSKSKDLEHENHH